MTTWTLIIFLAYAGGLDLGGGVALDNQRVDFFSEAECKEAKRIVDGAIKTEGFRRGVVVCVRRGAALLSEK